MNRLGSALGWGLMGLVGGAIIGAAAGFVLGIVRIENVAQAAMAGAWPVGLLGAFGAFAGGLLAKSSDESGSETPFASFAGALLGALLGKIIGVAFGADAWLLDSIASVQSDGLITFLLFHVDLVGGPQVVVGMFLGILTVGFTDTFFGYDSAITALVLAALATPAAAIIGALGGQIDWGTAIVIIVATTAVWYLLVRSDSGALTSSGGGKTVVKGKPKA